MSEEQRRHPRGRHTLPRIMEVLNPLLAGEAPASTAVLHENLWNIFARLLRARLSRLAIKLRVPRHRIDDLVQEVWVKILDRWDSFRQPDGSRRLLALSRKMLHDLAVDTIRRRDRRRASPLDTVSEKLIDDRESDPLNIAATQENREWLHAGLEKLREKDAWLLREHYLKDRPIRELAEEAGLTEKAIRCRMTRALKALRRVLDQPARNHPGSKREH